MRKLLCLLILLSGGNAAGAQELFIKEEPASTLPKGVIGLRLFSEIYTEPGNLTRAYLSLRGMYGLGRKLSVYATLNASNHHSKQLPPEFPDHNTPQIGVPLPWRFNGLSVYAKYRVLNIDQEKSHFRAAAYLTAAWLDVAHDEAEPNLLDDNSGVGGGIISTWLKNRFAVSFTGSYIVPLDYVGETPDPIPGLPSVPARVHYGRAFNYSLSFGYLLLPFSYKNYRQTNVNLYAEFLGKSYAAGRVFLGNTRSGSVSYEMKGTAVQVFSPNSYVELHPGIQAIIRSNLRIDFSVGFPLISRSYVHYYPLYTVGVQRYFYR